MHQIELKKSLRAEVRRQKASYTQAELASMSEAICLSVINDGLWRAAQTVLLYHPLPDEVDVRMLIQRAYDAGKCVLLPVVVGDDLELRLYQGPQSLAEGSYGILGPVGEAFRLGDYYRINLAIVPGMSFDSRGCRLGRGKGYYDRLLPRLTEAYLMGVCFPFQRRAQIPAEVHDVVMDEVVS